MSAVLAAPARLAPLACAAATPALLADGRLTFRAPAGLYRALPCWHSQQAWIGAVTAHPRLAEACAARRVASGTLLRVLRELAVHAEHGTGRHIAVADEQIAEALGVCTKTVQRARRAAEDLGALRLVLAGTDMSIAQRTAVLRHYSRGTRASKWRSLPNFYAATMPASVAVHAPRRPRLVKPVRGQVYGWLHPCPHGPAGHDQGRAVDNETPVPPGISANVHLPRRGAAPSTSPAALNSSRTLSTPSCGQPESPEQPPDRTGATRPTDKQHQRTNNRPPRRRVTPELRAYCAALQAQLPGFRHVSVFRIAPALSRYLSAGLSPTDLIDGLDAYLLVTEQAWKTWWDADQNIAAARYLVAMLTSARLAGYLRPPTPPLAPA